MPSAPASSLWLGGIQIPHDRGLVGHSDADVVLHALTDALLGAIGAGDIGDHFPPSDPQWRGAPSSLFLEHARDLVEQGGGRIVHVDMTIICEAPRIGPHRDAMRQRIADLLRLPARVGQRQGDDHRTARLHRPRRGDRGPGGRDGPDGGGSGSGMIRRTVVGAARSAPAPSPVIMIVQGSWRASKLVLP